MKRKVFSLILALAMAVSLFTAGVNAASLSYSDTTGHWAESAIERWSGYGIVQGSNGRFDPNGRLTCAQLATILANLLHLPEASDAGFTDNLPGAWYYDAINRCAAVGILNGNGNGTVTPEAFIARERAMVMLARALGFAAERDNILGVYADGYEVSAYARGYVAALVNAGAVQGNRDNRLLPKNTITRAEMVTMLDRLVAHYAAEDGMSVNAKDGGLVLVSGKNVRVVSAPAGTRIVVADGATGLMVNEKPVADGQTYIVPSTVIGIIASGGIYTPPAHTHTWNAGVVTKEPTCTEAGVKTYTCTTCGATKTEAIAALGHVWGAYTVTEHAVNGNDGKKTLTCSRCDTTESVPLLYKFYLGIESGSTVDMTVGEDYTAVFTMPATGGTVNTGSIDLTAKMQDVASLGVEGVKSHTTAISTGLGETDVTLNTWLPNCYNFGGATINATIGDKSCTYTLGAIDKTDSNMYTITATTDPAAASAAWQALTSHVTAGTQADDSKIVIKNGAYLMIGTEKLEFTSSEVGDLTLDNFNNMNALNETIRNHVKLSTCEDQGDTITAYLPAGTTLAVGSSVATLKDDCTITITLDEDEMSSEGESCLRTTLSSLKAANNASAMVQTLVNAFDELVRIADTSAKVDINITFSNVTTVEP